MEQTKLHEENYDLICVGGGIMSATLALMLKLIDKNKKILIFEKLDTVALESSEAWNNAGTGHSGFCELNYSHENSDGQVDFTKAVNICLEFEKSKQFWSYLIQNGLISNPQSFIHSVPHHSLVMGQADADYLKRRYAAMKQHVLFESMQYSDDHDKLAEWFPLIMQSRDSKEVIAATRMELGTEVNYEQLTHLFFKILANEFDTHVSTNHEVLDIDPGVNSHWFAEIKDLKTGAKFRRHADHIFIGAGGGALSLLQKVEISDKDGYGGFPVSGEWLICKNEAVIKQHHAKVYGKAGVNDPPMSVPHLDTRYINGKQQLLFGPFAGFSTKFLKQGSYLDWFESIKWSNIPSLFGAFWHNIPLTKYLVGQVKMNHADRMNELRKFIKDAKAEDWELKVAGQRVQIIKRDEKEGGILEFGTEIVHSNDGRITALLGASPGASTAVHIMVNLLKIAFSEEMKSTAWQERLSQLIPFWNKDVKDNENEFKILRKQCSETLNIHLP